MRTMFASLSIPNYRIYFSGTLLTNMGQWMARTAQSWLVLVILTHGNAAVLGWVMAVNFAPILLVTPWAGALADRMSKRRIMVTAQIVLAIDAAILSTLVLTGAVRLWMVFVIAAMDGLAGAFYSPATQAFVSELVPLKNLPNAVSLNSASFNGARLLGPGVGGLLIAAVGVGWVMAINVLCFIGFITTLLFIRADRLYVSPPSAEKARVRDGVRYVKRRPDPRHPAGDRVHDGNLRFQLQHLRCGHGDSGLWQGIWRVRSARFAHGYRLDGCRSGSGSTQAAAALGRAGPAGLQRQHGFVGPGPELRHLRRAQDVRRVGSHLDSHHRQRHGADLGYSAHAWPGHEPVGNTSHGRHPARLPGRRVDRQCHRTARHGRLGSHQPRHHLCGHHRRHHAQRPHPGRVRSLQAGPVAATGTRQGNHRLRPADEVS